MLANPINLLGCISAWIEGLLILPWRNFSICSVSQNTCHGDDGTSFSQRSWKMLLTLSLPRLIAMRFTSSTSLASTIEYCALSGDGVICSLSSNRWRLSGNGSLNE